MVGVVGAKDRVPWLMGLSLKDAKGAQQKNWLWVTLAMPKMSSPPWTRAWRWSFLKTPPQQKFPTSRRAQPLTSTLANIERMKAMGTKMGKLTLDTVMKGLIGMSDHVRIVLAFTAVVMVFGQKRWVKERELDLRRVFVSQSSCPPCVREEVEVPCRQWGCPLQTTLRGQVWPVKMEL